MTKSKLTVSLFINSKENKTKKEKTFLDKIIREDSFMHAEPQLKNVEDFRKYIRIKNKKFDEEFFIEDEINRGSYGVILKGKSKRLKKTFAFKLIFNKKALQQNREDFLKRIRNELAIQYKLKNRNINQFYGFFEIADTFCYVLEYEKYGDLSNFMKIIKRSVISESLIAFICLQILQALNYSHKSKIVHLDVKKQNILVDENLNFKLCDFSVSQEYNNLNEIKLHRVGSSLYISPENLNRKIIPISEVNKVDVYSLGVLLFNLAFRTFPYDLTLHDSNNFDYISKKIKEEDLKIPIEKNHSDSFRDFLEKTLDKKILKRISIDQALNHPWILASNILVAEREKINDNEKFLIMLITDNISQFNSKVSEKF